jgi:hypothetical protein
MDETRGYLAWGEAGQSKWAGTQNNDQQGFPTLGGWVVTWAGSTTRGCRRGLTTLSSGVIATCIQKGLT